MKLNGKICVVTGATRGAGLGIARALGEKGATVYCAGRSTRAGERTDGLPGTVEDAAEEVTSRGGRGIGVRCDLRDDAEVAALFDRVKAEQGGLDLLVNNAWAGYEGAGLAPTPFWKTDVAVWDRMHAASVRGAIVATQRALPLMEKRKRGLVVSTIAWMGGPFLGFTFYDLAKVAIARLMYGVALECRAHKKPVAALALAPGFLRSERVMAEHAKHAFDLGQTESTDYIGRAVAALAADASVQRFSGRLLEVSTLAREYGFTDSDGRQPPPFRVTADSPDGKWWFDLFGGAPEWTIP